MSKEKLRFSVYFVGDVFLDRPYWEYIWAESSKDAAIKFFEKFPKKYECQIETGDGRFFASELFPEREFVFIERELINRGSKLNFGKLDQHSKDVLFEIYKLYPEWLSYAENDSDWEERFNILFPEPNTEFPPFWVSTAWADYFDLTVGLGKKTISMAYNHPELKSIESWIPVINDHLKKMK